MIAIYPTDGLSMSDSPLGYVDHGSQEKRRSINELVAYLKSDAVRKEIVGLGHRAGLVGFNAKDTDPAVFNPDWGIDVNRIISPIPLPKEEVLREALDLYQAGGLRSRRPRFTPWIARGAWRGKASTTQGGHDLAAGSGQVEEDHHPALGPRHSHHRALRRHAARGDFEEGQRSADLKKLLVEVQGLQAGGGTDIYAAVIGGLAELKRPGPMDGYFPAVILMTDGQSDGSIDSLQEALRNQGYDVPVYSITFGAADERQLQNIARISGGKVFDGRTDMAKAFREAKGCN